MNQETIKKVIEGTLTTDAIPQPFCIVYDHVKSVIPDMGKKQYELITKPDDKHVTILEKADAKALINIFGLIPAVTDKNLGKIYDTPDGAYLRHYAGKPQNFKYY